MLVASVLGWSTSTAARMAKRYFHIGNVAETSAVALGHHRQSVAGVA
jgi:hypothetical protein